MVALVTGLVPLIPPVTVYPVNAGSAVPTYFHEGVAVIVNVAGVIVPFVEFVSAVKLVDKGKT